MNLSILAAIALGLLISQSVATLILLSRLLKGAWRRSPLKPATAHPNTLGKVSTIVPTLNEAARITPCLEGLSSQSYELREVIVVDSHSQDATQDIVKATAAKDPRFRLITDPPLPQGWIGRPWALHTGYLSTSPKSEWILGIDADTQPQPGLIPSLIAAAESEGFDLISLAPQFLLQYPGEWWLQPALLMTLLYRFDSAGVNAASPERVMANGQCFFCRRAVLEKLDGYTTAASSFCDDVTLARNIAAAGYRVGFLDGAKIIKVRMYEGMQETWQEWGRSLDLKDAASTAQVWGDIAFLCCVQGLPLFVCLVGMYLSTTSYPTLPAIALLGLNLFLLLLRWGMSIAIAPSYSGLSLLSPASWCFWLSPLADPLAVWRIVRSSLRTPNEWRGRTYS